MGKVNISQREGGVKTRILCINNLWVNLRHIRPSVANTLPTKLTTSSLVIKNYVVVSLPQGLVSSVLTGHVELVVSNTEIIETGIIVLIQLDRLLSLIVNVLTLTTLFIAVT